MTLSPKVGKRTRRLKALLFALKYPSYLRQIAQHNIQSLYEFGHYKKWSLPTVFPNQVIDSEKSITLQNFTTRDGNVSHLELLVIVSLIAVSAPKNLLEIGTFDGNTTLQMALNAPEDATVHTIDLPYEGTETRIPVSEDDIKYVVDQEKRERKYLNTNVEAMVIQHFGDSTAYDFNKFCSKGPVDFCFIDGGHTYESVKSDTTNALDILSDNGMILWHDYFPNCQGVFTYLNELGKTLPIKHFAGTNLAIYCRGTAEALFARQ